VGSGKADLEFHIHVPDGQVAKAYAGSLFEIGKRDEGDLQSQDEGTLDRIVNRWKEQMASLGKETIDTPQAVKARSTKTKEKEAS